MRYGNTSRSLSVFFHGLIVVGGLILSLYFGFFVLPTQFLEPFAFIEANLPVNLKLELAVIGFSLALISGYGLIHGLKSLANPSDDQPVLKSFGAFITEGYVAALFFLLNGVVYFNLTVSDSNPAFVIVVAIILCVGLLIAANIPMVKLFDNKHSSGMYKGIAYGFATNAFCITLFSAFLLISLVIAGPSQQAFNERLWMLVMYIAFSALVGVLALLCGRFLGKEPRHLSGLLGSLAVFSVGGAFIGIGVTELCWENMAFHFSSKLSTLSYDGGAVNAYAIAAIVFGSVVVVASVACLIVNYRSPKKVAHKA